MSRGTTAVAGPFNCRAGLRRPNEEQVELRLGELGVGETRVAGEFGEFVGAQAVDVVCGGRARRRVTGAGCPGAGFVWWLGRAFRPRVRTYGFTEKLAGEENRA